MILGIDWLYLYYVSLNCWTRRISFHSPNEPVIKWDSSSIVFKGRFIVYLRAQGISIAYHRSEGPSLQTIPMVCEFPDVFPNDLPIIPPDRKIYFGTDFLPKIYPIFIPPCRMAPAELRELKEQLKDFLNKGFIHPSVSLWVILFFSFIKKMSPFRCVLITAN